MNYPKNEDLVLDRTIQEIYQSISQNTKNSDNMKLN